MKSVLGMHNRRPTVRILVPTRPEKVLERQRPPRVERRSVAAEDDALEVVHFAHAFEGFAQRADLPQQEGEGVDIDLLVVRQAVVDFRCHEALVARHAGHLE